MYNTESSSFYAYPGGTSEKFLNADCPHFKNSNLYRFLSNYFSSFFVSESAVLAKSTCRE